jgi:hypothetical protein
MPGWDEEPFRGNEVHLNYHLIRKAKQRRQKYVALNDLQQLALDFHSLHSLDS